MPVNTAVRNLVVECERYLQRFDLAEISMIRRDMERWGLGPVTPVVVHAAPDCGFLDEALAAMEGVDALRDAIAAIRPHLRWVTYDSYDPNEIGPWFPKRHAFASIIGRSGFVDANDWELGLFLIAPNTLYRDHHHAAPELYAPLTGPHRWRFGSDQPWAERPAHSPVWNSPWAVHATLTGATPFLCLFVWTRDIDLPAKVVHATDWAKYEG
jgi:hypothetical protein